MSIINNILKNNLHRNGIIPRVLKKGSKVRLKHYSTFEPITNIVKSIQGNIITMNLPQKLLENNILTGDIIVCIFFENEEEYILSGNVTEITLSFPQKLIIKIEEVGKYTNMRKQNRYSVSLSANITKLDTKEVYFAVAKNISQLGAGFTSNIEIEVNSSILIEIAVAKDTILSFYGRIIRARKLANFYEYGLIQTDINESNRELLNKFINELKEEEDNLFASEMDD